MRFWHCFIFLWISTVDLHAQRLETNINSGWNFTKSKVPFSDLKSLKKSDWIVVNLPHCFNDKDALDSEPGYYQGNTWYKKFLSLSPDSSRRYYLKFEAANQVATLFVNGKQVGQHKGGYTGFVFEITPFLQKKSFQEILVQVDNSFDNTIAPLQGDWNFNGGIYRDVYLIETSSQNIGFGEYGDDGVKITSTVSDSKADFNLEFSSFQISKGHSVDVTLFDSKRKAVFHKNYPSVSKGKVKGALMNPELWFPETPSLYTFEITLKNKKGVLDQIQIPYGFRWFSCDGQNGFILNGNPIKIKGVCRTQDFEGLGFALPDDLHYKDALLIKDAGFNFVRCGHYPLDPAFVQACDRLGLMLWEEISISDVVDTSFTFEANCAYNLREMIRQHFNSPSIIMWGYMNEVLLARYRGISPKLLPLIEKRTKEVAINLEKICHDEDPGRLTGMANHHSTWYDEMGLTSIPDMIGWNLYFGWYHDSYNMVEADLDAEHAKYPQKAIMVSEYGAGSDLRINTNKPYIFDFSPQYQQLYHEAYVPLMMREDKKYLIGGAVWNFSDFGAEIRDETMPNVNNKGIVTFNRTLKDVYFYYKSAFRKDPVIHIASRDWPIRNVKTLNNVATEAIDIKVYSNAKELELWVDGKLAQTGSVKNFNSIFSLKLEPGKHLIEAKSPGIDFIDHFILEIRSTPENLKTDSTWKVLAVNCGSDFQYYQASSGITWVEDKPYSQGSWGFVGGKFNRPNPKNKRNGTQTDIDATEDDPLFQTARDSVNAYNFDVASGNYEITLLLNEPDPKVFKKLLYDVSADEDPKRKPKERIYTIKLNGKTWKEKLDLAGEYGVNKAVVLSKNIRTDGEPIEIEFKAATGLSIVSAIKIRKL